MLRWTINLILYFTGLCSLLFFVAFSVWTATSYSSVHVLSILLVAPFASWSLVVVYSKMFDLAELAVLQAGRLLCRVLTHRWTTIKAMPAQAPNWLGQFKATPSLTAQTKRS